MKADSPSSIPSRPLRGPAANPDLLDLDTLPRNTPVAFEFEVIRWGPPVARPETANPHRSLSASIEVVRVERTETDVGRVVDTLRELRALRESRESKSNMTAGEGRENRVAA